MEGYNILIPDYCRDQMPQVTMPVMAALQKLGHTPVIMEMASMTAMYQQMRYQRHGCYEIFQFYVKDLYKKHKIDIGLMVGLGGIFEDKQKKESHHLMEEAGIPNLVYLNDNDLRATARLEEVGAKEWEHSYLAVSAESLADTLIRQGFRNIMHIPLGTSMRIFYAADNPPDDAVYKVRLDDSWVASDYDVSFVGSYTPKRAELLRALVDSGIKLAIFGDMRWKQVEGLSKVYRNLARYLMDLNTIYNFSKICLDLPNENSTILDYVSHRVLDCPASGSMLVTYDRPSLTNFLEPQREAALFEDADDLVKVVKYYLEHVEKRETIAARGHCRIKEEAGWDKRMGIAIPQLEMHMLKTVA